MMLKTLTEQSCKTESDYLQYCTVGEDYFNLIDVRFDFPLCVLKHVTLTWRQEAWITVPLSPISMSFPHLSRDGGKCRRTSSSIYHIDCKYSLPT